MIACANDNFRRPVESRAGEKVHHSGDPPLDFRDEDSMSGRTCDRNKAPVDLVRHQRQVVTKLGEQRARGPEIGLCHRANTYIVRHVVRF
jgi:hypothetical protein